MLRSPHSLPAATRLGPVTLNAADADALAAFYQEALGLGVASSDAAAITLSAGQEALLILQRAPGASRPRRSAGLYHFCLAVPERRQLGWWLKRLTDGGFELQGLVDHHAAEAIYLQDPEGNGVELNCDRSRENWDLEKYIAMGNGPLDIEGLFNELRAKPVEGLTPEARVGHIHLHVGDLAASKRFYFETLGLDIVAELGGQAVFTSAGGYHHHVAFNLWHGRNAPPAPEGSQGLEGFEFKLGEPEALAAAGLRLEKAGYEVKREGAALVTRDASGNKLSLVV